MESSKAQKALHITFRVLIFLSFAVTIAVFFSLILVLALAEGSSGVYTQWMETARMSVYIYYVLLILGVASTVLSVICCKCGSVASVIVRTVFLAAAFGINCTAISLFKNIRFFIKSFANGQLLELYSSYTYEYFDSDQFVIAFGLELMALIVVGIIYFVLSITSIVALAKKPSNYNDQYNNPYNNPYGNQYNNPYNNGYYNQGYGQGMYNNMQGGMNPNMNHNPNMQGGMNQNINPNTNPNMNMGQNMNPYVNNGQYNNGTGYNTNPYMNPNGNMQGNPYMNVNGNMNLNGNPNMGAANTQDMASEQPLSQEMSQQERQGEGMTEPQNKGVEESQNRGVTEPLKEDMTGSQNEPQAHADNEQTMSDAQSQSQDK